MIGFIIGLFVGVLLGAAFMALMSAAKENRYTDYLLDQLNRQNVYIFMLKEDLSQERNEKHSIERRLKHLLQSSFIKDYDEKRPFTNQYVRDIEEVDQIAAIGKRATKERED